VAAVGLVVVSFFGVQYLRGARPDPPVGAIVVRLAAMTMGTHHPSRHPQPDRRYPPSPYLD